MHLRSITHFIALLLCGTINISCSEQVQQSIDSADSPNLNNLRDFIQQTGDSVTELTTQAKATLNGIGPKENIEAVFCFEHTAPFLYSICSVSQEALHNGDYLLRLFWKPNNDHLTSTNFAGNTQPLYTFDNLLTDLQHSSSNSVLKFAMNAGMYDTDFAPIGYTVLENEEILSLNLNDGGGNFHLLPNGVFWWDKNNTMHITESHAMQSILQSGVASPKFATQSGPMLVIDGQIHPKFNADSSSLKFRNGVGVCDDGNINFVISDEPVNFYEFASLFKDKLHCPNALFLDGGVASALYAPDIERNDAKNMGVMVGLIGH